LRFKGATGRPNTSGVLGVSIRYQSRLRFKATEIMVQATNKFVSIRYQSRLRFKERHAQPQAISLRRFNPLSIASSIQGGKKRDYLQINMFQSTINRVFDSRTAPKEKALPIPEVCFNPLSIASSIQGVVVVVLDGLVDPTFQSAINR